LHRSEDDGEIGYHAGHLELCCPEEGCLKKVVGVDGKIAFVAENLQDMGIIAADFWSFRVWRTF
jgi:hypothetical protein